MKPATIYSIFVKVITLREQDVQEQLWFYYILNYPFANSFNLENAFTYSTLLNTPRRDPGFLLTFLCECWRVRTSCFYPSRYCICKN